VAGVANETLDLRSANGSVHVWLAGSHNHQDETVTGLFRSIAEAAPGSYGVMYVLDDDVSYTWERVVMRRGAVSREVDTSLSPHIGVVEDPPGPEVSTYSHRHVSESQLSPITPRSDVRVQAWQADTAHPHITGNAAIMPAVRDTALTRVPPSRDGHMGHGAGARQDGGAR
jgi:hypothetical protein